MIKHVKILLVHFPSRLNIFGAVSIREYGNVVQFLVIFSTLCAVST